MGPEEAGAQGRGQEGFTPPMFLRNHRVCRVEAERDKCASQKASQEPVCQPQARTGDKPQETLCVCQRSQEHVRHQRQALGR